VSEEHSAFEEQLAEEWRLAGERLAEERFEEEGRSSTDLDNGVGMLRTCPHHSRNRRCHEDEASYKEFLGHVRWLVAAHRDIFRICRHRTRASVATVPLFRGPLVRRRERGVQR